ncbi:MAG: hypothetical protein Q9M37_06685 [Desulfonauticus sp.]|nr:hypothetical protein [Desulfonauticus sp.]
MSTILLANKGLIVDPKSLHYACNLSQEIKADLSILEIISQPQTGLQKLKQNLKKIRIFLENSMVNITYAEQLEVEHYKKIIQQELKGIQATGINPNIYIQRGDIVTVLKNFVQKHQDIVMAIIPSYNFNLNKHILAQLKIVIGIPLIVVK